jgi:hypothetical protein
MTSVNFRRLWFAGGASNLVLAGGLAFWSAAAAAGAIAGDYGAAERRPLQIRALASEIGDGWRWFWREPVVRAASLWAAAANLVTAVALMPVLSNRRIEAARAGA